MKVRKIVEKYEIWDEEEKTVKLEKKVKRWVPERFHRWIYVFGKKASEQILTSVRLTKFEPKFLLNFLFIFISFSFIFYFGN